MANVIRFTPGYYPDPNIGFPIANAQIYVGEPDTDPEIPANQKTVSALQENGTIVAVTQPIRTNIGGVPIYNGSPVTLLVDGAYSLKILNMLGSQQYYIPRDAENTDETITVETIAELRTITGGSAGGNSAIVLGYDTAGDGGGGPIRYWVDGQPAGTYTDNGGSIIVPTGGDGSAAWLWPTDYISTFNEWGAKGDGVSNDSAYFINALADELPVTGNDGDTYLLTSWTEQVLSRVKIFGNFTIKGDSTASFLRLGADIQLEGVTFDSFTYIIRHDSTVVTPVQITRLRIENCYFNNIERCVFLRATEDAASYEGANITINNNVVDTCGLGFLIGLPVFRYDIVGNKFTTIGAALTPSNGEVVCIEVGQDTQLDEQVSQDQGIGYIANNYGDTISNTDATGETNFIQAFGSTVIITGNRGSNMTAASTNNTEGLYAKGKYCVISDNSLINCGDNEGAIKLKGVADISVYTPPASRIQTIDNYIENNTVKFTGASSSNRIGIATTVGRVRVNNNTVTGANSRGILIGENTLDGVANKTMVSNNTIEDLTSEYDGTTYAILTNAGDDVLIKNNIIKLNGTSTGSLYGIRILTNDFVAGSANIVTENIIESLASEDTAGDAGNIRGIWIDQNNNFAINDVSIYNNKFKIGTTTKNVRDIMVTGSTSVTSVVITRDNETYSSSGGTYSDFFIGSGADPTNLTIRDNYGFTTVFPLTTGTTANRPTLVAADAGYGYWDTTLAKMAFWSGTDWRNSDGTGPI